MTALTVGSLLAECLRAAGVARIHGRALPGLGAIEVPSRRVAALLADAEARVGGRVGVAHLGDGALRFSGGPGAAGPERVVTDAAALPRAVAAAAAAARAPVPAATHLRVDLDLAAPVEPTLGPEPVPAAPDGDATDPHDVAAALGAASRPIVLAGPGVVRAGSVAGLRTLAAVAGVGVLNTWGAKGVLDWRSPHHLGTVGLQADDFARSGLDACDLIVTCGVDRREAPEARWRHGRVVDVAPDALDEIASRIAPATRAPQPTDLFRDLGAVTQDGWRRDGIPLAPTRITRHYADVLGQDGFLAADPGTAGFVVARTFPTQVAGSVHVPAEPDAAGFAVAAVVVARLRDPGRFALAVLDAPLADAAREVLEEVVPLGIPVPVEIWDPGGDGIGAGDHRDRLRGLVTAARSRLVTTAYDPGQVDELVAAAGPITAWGDP